MKRLCTTYIGPRPLIWWIALLIISAVMGLMLTIAISKPSKAGAPDYITVTITAPQQNQTYGGTIEVQATVHCSNQYGIQSIRLSVDTSSSMRDVIVFPTLNGPIDYLYTYSLDTLPLGDGSHWLSIGANDFYGSYKEPVVNFGVKNSGPQITWQNPGDGTVVSGTTNVSAQVTDAQNKNIKRVRLSRDGAVIDDHTVSPPDVPVNYTYAWDTTHSSFGGHQLTLEAWNADNETTSQPRTVYVINQNQVKSQFYFAEGTTRQNFVEYLCLQNPGNIGANCVITYMMNDGQNINKGYSVPPHSRLTVNVNSDVGPERDVATHLQADQFVIAERPMYFNYNGVWTGGHDVVGATAPADTWYFAEGTCRPNFDPYICIQNPGAAGAAVKITYMKGDGSTQVQDLSVGAHSRATVAVRSVLGTGDDAAHDFSAKVETTNSTNVIAERPMYFNYNGVWTGGHDVVGATAPADTWYFAEGTCRPNFDPYICIQNPGAAGAAVKITYMKGDGSTQVQDLSVGAHSRATVAVRSVLGTGDDTAHDFSAKVETTNSTNVIAERPMYFNYNGVWTGGHDVVGATAPADTWYFAEGTCRPNFDPYICIQNPGAAGAAVKITYMKGDGSTQVQDLSVGAHSRATIAVRSVLGTGDDAAHDFSAKVETTNSTNVIAERPMYFNYNGVWTGGHDVVGYVPDP